MNKIVKFLMLVCALGTVGVASNSKANAADIAGKVGVGTYNTQAEFADVKVVQGATTLYASDFTAGMAEWTTAGGTWAIQNGFLRQTGGGTPAMAWTGNTQWSNYTLTLRARKISGNEGFLITFGAPGDVNNYWWNLGGYGNSKHVLAYPGTSRPENAGSIQTGVWYDIKVQINLNNVKCYLNGALIQESYRGIEASERNDRIQTILNSPGFQLLTAEEKTSLQELFNRDVYLGNAARDTFSAMPSNSAFTALSAQAQVDIIRKVGAKQLTWKTGYGFDGSNLNKDNAIKDSMDQAVMQYNSLGVFEKHVTANNDNNVPNADGSYNGNIRFGAQYTRRCALHELSHTLGIGTGPGWYAYDGSVSLMDNDRWRGMYGNAQLSVFDGPGSVVPGSPGHILVYGENYDQESNPTNDYRHILLVAAMRRDMGVASTLWMPATTSIANGTYRLTPRHAPSSALDVISANPNNSASIGIYTSSGQNNQKFLLDLQSDGSYRIRTALPGNRCVELPYGNTANGTNVKLWDDNGNSAQRWYFIPMGDGWYKIAPKNSRGKSIDIIGGPGATADGTLANSWDYLDGLNQQWQLTPSEQSEFSTLISDGSYRITPRNAPGSALDILGSNPANNAGLAISAYTGAANQEFLLSLQSDNSYRIRTGLAGNRSLDLPSGDLSNGNKIVLYDGNDNLQQRWYFVPTGDGWFKIAPRLNINKSFDINGGPGATADGTLVQNWDYLAATNQQWLLSPFTGNLPKLSISNASLNEGNQGSSNITFVVKLSRSSTEPITVKYATGDGVASTIGATAGSDYTTATGTLTFAPGETQKNIDVVVPGDTLIENDETFVLQLSEPSQALLDVAAATGTIVNDDAPALSINDVSLNEGNSGTVTANFIVKLSSAGIKPVTVKYSTANGSAPIGSATAGSDYNTVSGTLTFAPGQTSKNVIVQVAGDLAVEADETFVVNLTDVVGATLQSGVGTGLIVNDDTPVLNIADLTVTEGDSGTGPAAFIVTLSQPAFKTITVAYATAAGTARTGSDFTSASGILTFAPGTVQQTITVPIVGDILAESSETFTLTLSGAVEATIGSASATATILDNDETVVPGLTILSPLSGSIVAAMPPVLIEASDNSGGSGIDHVDYTLQRVSTGAFWNGTAWSGTTAIALPTSLQGGVWKNTGALPLKNATNALNNLVDGNYAVTAAAYDRAGNRKTTSSSFRVDTLSPSEVTVTAPLNGSFTNSLPMITVNASDNGGSINRVEVSLRRKSDGVYWTGTAWGTTKMVTLSTLKTNTGWLRRGNLPFPTAVEAAKRLTDGGYVIVATAYDLAGNVKTATSNFVIDTVLPSTLEIVSPRNGSLISSLPFIKGTAVDNIGGSGIERIDLFLVRNSDGVFWTGSAWYDRSAVALPTRLLSGEWRNAGELPIAPNYAYTESMLDGSYSLKAVATDRAGNRSAVKSSFSFKSKKPAAGSSAQFSKAPTGQSRVALGLSEGAGDG